VQRQTNVNLDVFSFSLTSPAGQLKVIKKLKELFGKSNATRKAKESKQKKVKPESWI